MKIGIIVPRSFNKKQLYKEYPLGAGYIGTVLDNMGYSVKIYDQNIDLNSNKDLAKVIIEENYDVLGFSMLTATYPTGLDILKRIKTLGYNGKIFAGGIHPSLFPKECVKDGFSYVIKGEGEIVVTKLLDYFNNKLNIEKVPNIAYRHGDIIVDKENERLNINVNRLPFVNRNLFDLEKYTTHSISGSRGCPFRCKFCCNYNHLTNVSLKDRIRTVESIVDEIEDIVKNFGGKDIFFVDDIFFSNINNLRRFNEILKEKKIKIRYNAQFRATMINDEVCTLLKESGCKKIEVGVESGSEKILNDACKGIQIKDIKRCIEIGKKNGLIVKTNWIYGLPGSIKEQYKSVDLMIETMPNEISIHQLIPFPGTEYYDNREKYGISIKNPLNFESFCYGDLDDNITYDYMSRKEYEELILYTIEKLESVGYVSSDNKNETSEYIYTTPFNKESLNPVHERVVNGE